MKKFFTLVSVAMAAMSLNAQVEKYDAITYDVTNDSLILAPEFAAVVDAVNKNWVATNAADGMSVVKFGTTNIEAEAIGGTVPADVADVEGDNTSTHPDIDKDGNVGSWNDITWTPSKKGWNSNAVLVPYIAPTGNPYVGIFAELVMDGDVPKTWVDANGTSHDYYRPGYKYYLPDGSAGLPKTGAYYKFTTKVAGELKIQARINKGKRDLFVVDAATAKAVDYKAEGYVNGFNGPDGVIAYATPEQIDSLHIAVLYPKNEAGEPDMTAADPNPYVVAGGNQEACPKIIIQVEAGKTYLVFNSNTQLGFQGYEFTPAGGTEGIVEVVTDNVNAPMYNVAGQQVTKGYKGIVIQNGKKYILR